MNKDKKDSVTLIKHSEKTGGRHTVYDNQSDCITVDNVPSMTMKGSPSPIRNGIRT